jgi:sugar phosphate isomerase/epimerase
LHISMATANLFHIPFAQALRIIKQSGFVSIELDGYWSGGENWVAGQHIMGIKPKDVLKMVDDSGLAIASFHDLSGVIEDGANSVIAHSTYEYLDCYDFPCVVVHTPHRKTQDMNWWNGYRQKAMADLQSISRGRLVCIENMVSFEGYVVPLLEPEDMMEFAQDAGIFVNIDTTHYAQCGVDITRAAVILKNRVKTIHLSDFSGGVSHLPPGDGTLDFKGFYSALDIDGLYATTIECNLQPVSADEQRLIETCRRLKETIEAIINDSRAL